jgi:hypothetical protein
MAGVSGFEPEPKVLETSMLTVDTIPLEKFSISDLRFGIEKTAQSKTGNLKSKIEFICFLYAMCACDNDCKTS